MADAYTTPKPVLKRWEQAPGDVTESEHTRYCESSFCYIEQDGSDAITPCPVCRYHAASAKTRAAIEKSGIGARYWNLEWSDLELPDPLPRLETACGRIGEIVGAGHSLVLAGAPGCGKCLAPGTLVLMFDGKVKKVEEIRVGECVMGPDSCPRRVVSLASGREEMYQIFPKKGDPYTVNASHILSLRMNGPAAGYKKGEIVNISVRDYLAMGSNFKHRAKGYRCAVDFPSAPLPLEPYFLGLWLGDGDATGPVITKPDPEVRTYLEAFATAYGMKLSPYDYGDRCPRWAITNGNQGGKTNPVLDCLRRLGVIGDKHIPFEYLRNDRMARLELLAGLIDSDGHVAQCIEFSTKIERLAEQVRFLARSLGLAAYGGPKLVNGETYYRVGISGDLSVIPTRIARKRAAVRRQRKDVLNVGIGVESVGMGDYFGFSVDGPDRRFVLGDFTVTHNTQSAVLIVKAAIRAGFSAHLDNLGRVSAEIREGYSTQDAIQEAAVVRQMSAVDLLVLDDLGAGETMNAEVERRVLYLVMEARQNAAKPTIVTTNLTVQELSKAVGVRIMNRLQPMAAVIFAHGKNYRLKNQQEVLW